MDYSAITAAVDFSGVETGIIAVAVVLAAILVARKDAKFLLGFLK